MAIRLPTFRRGMKWDDVRATEMQNLVSEVKALRGALSELQARNHSQASIPQGRSVVVTDKAGRTLRCKEVKSQNPPRPCDSTCYYHTVEPTIEAYPDVGADVDDFDVWDGGTLDNDSPFYKIHWYDGVWHLEKPAATVQSATNIKWALVKVATSVAVTVQPIDWGPGGVWVNDGDAVIIDPQPLVNGTAYTLHAQNNSLVTGMTVPIIEINSRWYVLTQALNFQHTTATLSPPSTCS